MDVKVRPDPATSAPDAAGPPSGLIHIVVGTALMLGGPVLYFMLIERAFLRGTGLSALVPMACGLAFTITALRIDRRKRVLAVAVFNVLFLAAFCAGFFGAMGVPNDPAFEALVKAPGFELLDHQARPVSLSSLQADGPVLLVTYRGHW